jgi:hypothetical protein
MFFASRRMRFYASAFLHAWRFLIGYYEFINHSHRVHHLVIHKQAVLNVGEFA